MTHDQLCHRARAWLRGTRRCNPVYSNNASCSEIPDAIGWSSSWGCRGSSTVVECKTSVSDFYADKKKKVRFRHKVHGYISARRDLSDCEQYEPVANALMGDYRFYMCEPGILTIAMVEKHAPDHGLLFVKGRIVSVVRQAPKREAVDKDSEIRYLRFAIINRKDYLPAPVLECAVIESLRGRGRTE